MSPVPESSSNDRHDPLRCEPDDFNKLQVPKVRGQGGPYSTAAIVDQLSDALAQRLDLPAALRDKEFCRQIAFRFDSDGISTSPEVLNRFIECLGGTLLNNRDDILHCAEAITKISPGAFSPAQWESALQFAQTLHHATGGIGYPPAALEFARLWIQAGKESSKLEGVIKYIIGNESLEYIDARTNILAAVNLIGIESLKKVTGLSEWILEGLLSQIHHEVFNSGVAIELIGALENLPALGSFHPEVRTTIAQSILSTLTEKDPSSIYSAFEKCIQECSRFCHATQKHHWTPEHNKTLHMRAAQVLIDFGIHADLIFEHLNTARAHHEQRGEDPADLLPHIAESNSMEVTLKLLTLLNAHSITASQIPDNLFEIERPAFNFLRHALLVFRPQTDQELAGIFDATLTYENPGRNLEGFTSDESILTIFNAYRAIGSSFSLTLSDLPSIVRSLALIKNFGMTQEEVIVTLSAHLQPLSNHPSAALRDSIPLITALSLVKETPPEVISAVQRKFSELILDHEAKEPALFSTHFPHLVRCALLLEALDEARKRPHSGKKTEAWIRNFLKSDALKLTLGSFDDIPRIVYGLNANYSVVTRQVRETTLSNFSSLSSLSFRVEQELLKPIIDRFLSGDFASDGIRSRYAHFRKISKLSYFSPIQYLIGMMGELPLNHEPSRRIRTLVAEATTKTYDQFLAERESFASAIMEYLSKRALVSIARGDSAMRPSSTLYRFLHNEIKPGPIPTPEWINSNNSTTRSPAHLKIASEIQRGLYKDLDSHFGFSALEIECKRAPGQHKTPFERSIDAMGAQRKVFLSSSPLSYPGTGTIVHKIDKERIFVPNPSSRDPYSVVKMSLPWASHEFEDFTQSIFCYARGCMSVIPPADLSKYIIKGTHYSYIVFNEHFCPEPDGAALVPTAILKRAIAESADRAARGIPNDGSAPHPLLPSELRRMSEIAGSYYLDLTSISNLAGYANAFPPGAEPYFKWEQNLLKAYPRRVTVDYRGHVHSSYIVGGAYSSQMTQRMNELLEPLRQGHDRVNQTANALRNIHYWFRISRSIASKGQTHESGAIDFEADEESEPSIENPLTTEEKMRIAEAYAYHQEIKARVLTDQAAVALTDVDALSYWNRPNHTVSLRTDSWSLKVAGKSYELPDFSVDPEGVFALWQTYARPYYWRFGRELRFIRTNLIEELTDEN